jgi:hypothetical protein
MDQTHTILGGNLGRISYYIGSMRSIILKQNMFKYSSKNFDKKHLCYIGNLKKLQLQIRHILREQKKIKLGCE